MKYISFCLFILLFCCTQKSGLHPELEKAIQEYHAKVPIPQSTDLKDYVFIYEADFALKDDDTLIRIVRRPSGIPENSNCYGIYNVGDQIPVVVYDEKNLAGRFIRDKVKNATLQKYEVSEKKKHYVDYPPVYSFEVKGSKLKLMKIDTISDNWSK